MKKLLTIGALLGAAVSLSYGQGTVNFSAGASATTRESTNSVMGGPTTGQTQPAGAYYYALFQSAVGNDGSTIATSSTYGTSLDPTTGGFTFTGLFGTNTAAVGRFTGNPGTDNAVVNGATGSSANFVVVGWSANIAGADWNAFRTWYANGNNVQFTGWAGRSGVAQNVQLGGGLTPAGTIFGAGAGQVSGFVLGRLDPVPEPSTMALAGLGAAALVIFRRRKA